MANSSSGSTKDATSIVEAGLDGAMHGDEAELARMGYKQELKRDLSLLQNFGVSFSIISVITGVPSLFSYGLTTGGPGVMVWGWVVVSCFTLLVGLAMAEVCSAHPTSGGPYFWAAMLSRPKNAAFASWITGWFNLLGQVAVTTGISFACANFISTASTLGTDYVPSANKTIGIYAGVLCAQGLINTFGVHLLKYLNNISVWWHAIGTVSLVIAILAKAPTHQSGKFVFATFIDGTGIDGVGWSERASPAYVAVIGILMAQYTLTGFDASAHMTEETHNAAMSGSIGIVMAIGVSALLGWFLILGLLFSMQDYDNTIASATGQPVTQIFLDTVGEKGAIVLMVIVVGAMFFCGTFSITSNSRMMYAFSRDGAIPGFFHKVDKRWKSPIRTVWLACTLSFILGLPSLGSSVAFSAATSIATIGLYISYAIPIALRVVYADQFVRGPFHLGIFSFPVAIAAVTWIAFISIVFVLPELNPVNSQTLNYAVVAVGIVLTYSLGFWLVSARKWFTGPVKQIAAEGQGINITDPAAMAEKPGFD
ncbi:APC amino acid permease [Dentipellis sp. KUC8613]|nr:APC amino acid permease [Dentipellis sp. KUC8613]